MLVGHKSGAMSVGQPGVPPVDYGMSVRSALCFLVDHVMSVGQPGVPLLTMGCL